MKIERFCARYLRPLWPHQIEVAKSKAFITAVAKPRRAGGSELAMAMAIHTAFENRGCTVLILSATRDAARRLTEEIGATLNATPDLRCAVVDDQVTRIRLRNGSQIVSLPASQRQVRGYGASVMLVILDEASFMPAELWTAAHYVALDERGSGSRIVMLGTPFGGRDHFFRQAFEAGQDGNPDYLSFQWRAGSNPNLDTEYLERMRHRVSPAEYAAEVLGEWSDAAGQLFSDELIEAQTIDCEIPDLADLAEIPARPIVGLDYGVSFDQSAAGIIYRLPALDRINADLEPRPRFLLTSHVWPVKTRLSKVIDDIYRVPASWFSTETSGVGSGPSQQLEEKLVELHKSDPTRRRLRPVPRIQFVATTSPKKTAGYGCLLALAEQGVLFWARDPDFLRQLRGLRFEQGERGFTRIEAESEAVHDDIVDAAMLATVPWVPKKGSRIKTALTTFADPRRAAPDAELPEVDEDYVESGAGIRVWRRPPLQSAAGPELWMPPATSPRKKVPRPEPLRIDDRDQVLEAITQRESRGRWR